MEKSAENISNSQLSSQKIDKSQSSDQRRKNTKKIQVKIEFYNQTLEDAIKGVKTNITDNPEWKLSSTKIS